MAIDMDFSTLSVLLFCLIPLFLVFYIKFKKPKHKSTNETTILYSKIPKSYPLIGSFLSMVANKDRRLQWISDIILSTPNLTFTLIYPLNLQTVFTANPSTVQHMVKTHFDSYPKGKTWQSLFTDVLGNGIFNVNGEMWKYQRQVAIHEFSNRSLRRFIENVVSTQVSDRLIAVLAAAAANKTVVDLQDILQRFAFDSICKIAFGYESGFLLRSRPDQAEVGVAFDDAIRLSFLRLFHLFPVMWKIKRALNIGSEKKLRVAVERVREFAKEIVRAKQRTLSSQSVDSPDDLLSRFLMNDESSEEEKVELVTDIVINIVLAGRDTTSAALTWFFWLISKNPQVESQLLDEIGENLSVIGYDEVKNKMMYTHALLCESMRFYPPVPTDFKEATKDDVLPDGTFVKKGTRVIYHSYAMGRADKIWGADSAEFRPERWLERDAETRKWTFLSSKVDAYSYPVFQAGPRICVGKDLAFLIMKRVVAGVLQRFKVVPVMKEQGAEPVFVSYLTSKMKGGFPVTIQERVQ